MTEKDAKTKWCPMVRSGVTFRQGANRWIESDGTHRIAQCLGSACMMWRWVHDERIDDGYCGLGERLGAR